MAGFIRVRAVDGPKHEFDVPAGELDANPDLYEVLDPDPVDVPRPAEYVSPAPKSKPAHKPAPKSKPAHKPAPKKPAATAAPEPSVGKSEEGDA